MLRGKNGSSGIGLVETYDLDQSVDSGLANVSSRGFVGPGDDAIIGGIIIGPGDAMSTRVVLRAIGPSLSQFGITNALANPTIELRDGNGAVLGHNDDWHSGPNAAAIEALQLAPNNPRESATLQVLLPGAYTAIVRGNSDGTGIALLEAYDVGATDGLQ